jgi:hypothetical protein
MRWRRPVVSACTATSVPPTMMNPDPAIGHHHLHVLADQSPRHVVAVAVDLDRTIGLNPADQLARLPERRPAIEAMERRCLVPFETHQRRFAGRAVHPDVGNLAHSPLQMRLELRPAVKRMTRNRIARDVTDPALVFAHGARPVRRAGVRPEAPVACEGMQTLIEAHSRVDASWWSTSARALSNSTSCGTPPKR